MSAHTQAKATCPTSRPRMRRADPLLVGQGGPYTRRMTTGTFLRRTDRPGLFEFAVIRYGRDAR